jgi:putative ABC transport system permease protein
LVVGVLAPKGKVLDTDFDRTVVVPYRVLLSTFGSQWPTQIGIKMDAPEHLAEGEDELVGILRRTRLTPPGKPNDFVINRSEQLMELYNKLTGALYAALAGIGFITLLVGGIGITNIMLVSVRERTREIGVRRALGATKRTIVVQFMLEAAGVSALGGALGTLIGLSLAKLVAWVSPLPAAVQPSTVLFGVGFAASLGLLAGIWPAARAARLDPAEALRYE